MADGVVGVGEPSRMQTQVRRRHHHRRRHLRGHGYFKRLGPGFVTGAADDDPSGIGTYSQVGAAFGLALVWSTLWLLPIAVAVQEASARLGLVSGQGLAALIRQHTRRWVLFGAVALVVVANTFNLAADLASMGAATRLVVPLPQELLVVAFTVLMLALEVWVPYHQYAKVLRWLALSLAAYVVVLFMVHVDWGQVAEKMLVPSLDLSRAEIAALIALFGTTVSPYLFFWQAAEEVEEEHDPQRPHGPVDHRHLVAMRVDVAGGMISGIGIMFAIIAAAASTLHRAGIDTVATAEQAARALDPIAGSTAGLVFALGIVGLGLLSVPVLAGSTAYALSESVGWHEGLSARFREARPFYLVIVGAMIIGLGLDLGGLDPIRGLYLAAILNGLVAPPLIGLILYLSRSPEVLPAHRSGPLSTTVLAVALVVSAGLPVLYVVR
jgi:NRAMP (natural resistance-associated macrophage protein)-like metal ion transporter